MIVAYHKGDDTLVREGLIFIPETLGEQEMLKFFEKQYNAG